MVSHWIFFLCYTCFGNVPSIVSKSLTGSVVLTAMLGEGKEEGRTTTEANKVN